MAFAYFGFGLLACATIAIGPSWIISAVVNPPMREGGAAYFAIEMWLVSYLALLILCILLFFMLRPHPTLLMLVTAVYAGLSLVSLFLFIPAMRDFM